MIHADVKEPDFDALWEAEEVVDTGADKPAATTTETAAAAAADEEITAAITGTETAATETAAATTAAGEGEPAAATATETAATAAEPAARPTYEGDDAWLNELSDTTYERVIAERQARAQAEQERNALHGRLAPVQRALSDAQKRLAQQPQPAAAKPAQQVQQAQDSFFDSEKWKQYQQDFPGDAEVLRAAILQQGASTEAQIRELHAELQQLRSQTTSAAETAAQVQLERETRTLAQEHPDWEQLNQSDDFWSWFESFRASQPEEVRGAYYDQATLGRWFTNAGFVSRMLTSFKRETGYGGTQTQTTQVPAQQDQQHAQRSSTTAQDTRLSMAAAPQVKAAGASVPRTVNLEAMPEAQAFEHLWKTDF